MAPLATVEQLAFYLRVPVDSLDLDQAQLLLDGVSGQLRTLCRWSISAEDAVTWVRNGDGSDVLALPTLHLRAVTSVTVDGVALSATDYQWSEAGYLVREGAVWPSKLRAVSVVVSHGHDPVPPEVVTVVCSVTSRVRATAGRGPVTSVKIGDYSETVSNSNATTGAVGPDSIALLPNEQAILDRYTITLA